MENQSPNATAKLMVRAKLVGCKAEIIENSKGHYRRQPPLGSTSVPQKVVILDDIKFSVGGAKQYLYALENIEAFPCREIEE
jgi:hypothetical protein